MQDMIYIFYWFTVYSELAQILHIGPFTISMQLYITLIKSLSVLQIRFKRKTLTVDIWWT